MKRSREQTKILYAALEIGYRSETGTVTPVDLATLHSDAERHLDPEDPARLAIDRYADAFFLARFGIDRSLPEIGRDLRDAIQLAQRPDPPDVERKDIHG